LEVLGAILIVIFFICAFVYFFVSLGLLFFIYRQKCGLPFMYISAPGWAMQHYLGWCKENSIEPNESQVSRYKAATKILGVGIIFLVSGITFLAIGGQQNA
jgi:hypothetical protein